MSPRSLEDLLRSTERPVDLLRNSQAGPNVYPGVPAEYTQLAGRAAGLAAPCVLYNQWYHMTDLMVEGPVPRSCFPTSGQQLRAFGVDRAKQFVACTHDGYLIGE